MNPKPIRLPDGVIPAGSGHSTIRFDGQLLPILFFRQDEAMYILAGLQAWRRTGQCPEVDPQPSPLVERLFREDVAAASK